jgi:signal transduction histidine kinase
MKPALWISLLYLVFGSVWIIFSDQLLALLAPDQRSLPQTLKGLFYVALTALLLWGLVNAFWRHIRQQEAYFRLLFAENPLAMWVCEAGTLQIRDVNQAACRLWQLSPSELQGHLLRDLLSEPQALLFQQWLNQGFAGGGLYFSLTQGEVPQHLFITHQPMPQSFGLSQASHLFIVQDFTERIEAQRRQETLTQELLAQNADLMAFTSLISHLLRVPAANIEGLLVLYQQASEPERQRIIEHLHTSSQDLEDAIQQLNHIVTARQGDQMPVEQVDFAALFSQVQTMLAEPIEACGPMIHLDFQVPHVVTLRSSLRTIFYHLLSNALRFRAPERTLSLEVVSRATPEGVHLSFRDNGLGLDLTRYGDQLFLPYKRFHPLNYGKGLGLYLVASLCRCLGVQLSVDSQPDQGAVFSLLLPDILIQTPSEASPVTEKVSE